MRTIRSLRVAAAVAAALLATSLAGLLGAGPAAAASAPDGHTATVTTTTAHNVKPDYASQGTITTPFNATVLCLDANPAALGSDGDPVQVATCDGAADEQWTVSDATTGDLAFTIVNAADGKCLEASNSQLQTPGDPIDVSTCTGAENQQWGISHFCDDPWVCSVPDNVGFLGNSGADMVATDPDPATSGSVPSMQIVSPLGENYAPGNTWQVPPGPIAD